jgi:hypothetical protein
VKVAQTFDLDPEDKKSKTGFFQKKLSDISAIKYIEIVSVDVRTNGEFSDECNFLQYRISFEIAEILPYTKYYLEDDVNL